MALLQMTHFSPTLGKQTQLHVILPDQEKPEKTLWLLHGWSEDSSIWSRCSMLEEKLRTLNVAAVMPDGGLSFYCDMAHGPAYFTYITQELPGLCQRMFSLPSAREDNFIGGLSMGGYGAVKLALSCPDQYAGAACLSASNFPQTFLDKEDAIRPKTEQWYRWMDDIFGNAFPNLMGTNQDLYALAEKVLKQKKPAPRIYHCIGTGDPGYASAQQTRQFFSELPGNPFDYKYVEGPGIHDWFFWNSHIDEMLEYFGLKEG